MRHVLLLSVVLCALSPWTPPAAGQAPAAPLGLAEVVALAEQRNPAIAAARQAVAAAQARVALARAGRGPTVTASTAPTVSSGTGTTPQGFSASAAIGATYVLYDSGGVAHAVRQAEANLRAAQLALEATRQDVALGVAQAYVNVLRAERAVRVREQVVVQTRELLRLAEGQFRAGVVARADVVRAQANLAAAEGELLAARNAVDQAKAALNAAIGQPAPTPVAVAPPPPTPRLTLAQAALAPLAEGRPEVRRALAELEAAEAGLALAQAAGGWRVTLDGRATQTLVPSASTAWSVSGTVSVPLSDAGRTAAAVAEAQAALAAARARVETARLTAQQQSLQAFLNVLSAQARIESARAGLAFAQESLRLAQGRYAAGAGTLLEVTDAQTALVQAEQALANAEFDALAAVLSLRHALGRSVVTGAI
jgi:outer membrane protein TolC